jgi:4-carboxymuconolactone decarboxylase
MKTKLSVPRVAPLRPDEWSDTQRAVLEAVYERGQVYNNLGTLARHRTAFDRILAWGAHVMRSTLTPRERELVILRTGWRCCCEYVWRQHRVIAQRDAGMVPEEIEGLREAEPVAGFSRDDRLLIQAADELFGDHFLSEETWRGLTDTHSTEQMMDIIFTAGTYAMMSSLMNSLGVQLDESFRDDAPELVRSGLALR